MRLPILFTTLLSGISFAVCAQNNTISNTQKDTVTSNTTELILTDGIITKKIIIPSPDSQKEPTNGKKTTQQPLEIIGTTKPEEN